MASVTFSASVGGDGSTVTDDSNASTGLANGGHRARLVPAMAQVVAVAANTVTKATEAAASAATATTQASNAAASAASAAAIAGAFVGTSTTSLAIGIGSKSFATQSGEQYTAGIWLSAVSQANNSNWMFGQVTSYSGTTLVLDVQVVSGSGTYADWNLSLVGARGVAGPTGPESFPVAAAGGTVDAITATFSPAITLTDKQACRVVSAGANTSTAPTFAPDGLTARTITSRGGAALVAGDMGPAGFVSILQYNLANTRWDLLNPAKLGPLTIAQLNAAISDADAAVLATNTFTGAQIGTVTALTSTAGSIAINLAANNNFSHTMTENTTLAAPTNPGAGQSGVIVIKQHASAVKTLAYNTFWKFAGGTIPALTATVSAVDVFAYYVESATSAICQLIKDVK